MQKITIVLATITLTMFVLCLESCKKTPNTVIKPEVETSQVAYITDNSALCVGFVKSDGGSVVVERGFCWGVEHNPIISENHLVVGEGLGEFSCNITHLESNTTYYLRAYARNSVGESYGNEIVFSTLNSNSNTTLPIINLQAVEYITDSSAICSAEIIDNGGAEIIDCGICWSENHNPLIIDNHESDSSVEFGPFTCAIKNLNSGTTYYVRAYASNNQGISYSNEICFTTKPSAASIPFGAISGIFSVSDDLKVYFSQGNLQYQASTNTWRFAEHQWDYVGSTEVETGEPGGTVSGSSNHLISPTYSGWIDLFGWGTSGNNHGSICYQPWSTSQSVSDYNAYGSYTFNLFDEDGTADWGSNSIYNGDNTKQWRTLTQSEWEYVFKTRNTVSGIRFVKARINRGYVDDINGIILLPDNWDESYYPLREPNIITCSFRMNYLTVEQWSILESLGAVFLPAGGSRDGTKLRGVSNNYRYSRGHYWASTRSTVNYVNAVSFDDDSFLSSTSGGRYYGNSVRLVCVTE